LEALPRFEQLGLITRRRFLHNAEVITITSKRYRLRNRSVKEPAPAETAACGDEKK
jgi:hypothetical protein